MLLGFTFFAKELLKPSALLLDVRKSLMLHIGNMMLSMVITLSTKIKIIPIASMVLVTIMRSKAGFSEVS